MPNYSTSDSPIDPNRSLLSVVKNITKQHPIPPSVTTAMIATEGMSYEDENSVNQVYDRLESDLSSLHISLNANIALESIDDASDSTQYVQLRPEQVKAGAIAGMLAANSRAFINKKHSEFVATESMTVISQLDNGSDGRYLGNEAYDETINDEVEDYSVTYNIKAVLQDPFAEALYKTTVISPDKTGYVIKVRDHFTQENTKRNISGAVTDFKRRNILRAFADPTVLKNDLTRIIPIVRPENLGKFVDPTKVAASDVEYEGMTYNTAPLKTGVKMDIKGVSQTDTLLASGVMDITDSLDTAINIKSVYLSVSDGTNTDILYFDVESLPLSLFTANQTQGNYRSMALNFISDAIMINKDTKQHDGSALVALAAIVSADLVVRLNLEVTGNVNIETGELVVYGNHVSINTVVNGSGGNVGEIIPIGTAPASTLNGYFLTSDIFGYKIHANRSNLNRRQRGQLIGTSVTKYAYALRTHSPITALHPVTSDDLNDSNDLTALITGTRIRTSASAVKTLLDASDTLRSYVDVRDANGNHPEILGIGGKLIIPTYYEDDVDMGLVVDSVNSQDRPADIQAALVNIVRDYIYRIYRDSEYQVAADQVYGGNAPKPTVVLATDPVIAQYLMINGDLRTLGDGFDIKVVSTIDKRMSGKLFGVFVNNSGSNQDVSDPLSFGAFAYSPELTVVIPVSRDGQYSKELSVNPRYSYVVNCPAMLRLNITGIPDVVLSKIVDYSKLV